MPLEAHSVCKRLKIFGFLQDEFPVYCPYRRQSGQKVDVVLYDISRSDWAVFKSKSPSFKVAVITDIKGFIIFTLTIALLSNF